jgi:hypothetical protein
MTAAAMEGVYLNNLKSSSRATSILTEGNWVSNKTLLAREIRVVCSRQKGWLTCKVKGSGNKCLDELMVFVTIQLKRLERALYIEVSAGVDEELCMPCRTHRSHAMR